MDREKAPADRREMDEDGDKESRQEVARKGGLSVSKDREHMRAIGRKGGIATSSKPGHMALIGAKGGAKGAHRG